MSAALAVVPWLWATDSTQRRPLLTAKPKLAPKPRSKPDPVQSLSALKPQLAFYRKYTEGMLRRYMRFRLESGRVPSMLGKELFRSKVTSYRVESFDDVVIFVHDIERCLNELDTVQQLLISRMALQEYTLDETAAMMQLKRMTVTRRYDEALDQLTDVFLTRCLLEPFVECRKCCQGGVENLDA